MPVSFWDNDFKFSVTQRMTFTTITDVRTVSPNFSMIGKATSKNLFVDVGLKFNEKIFEFTTSAFYGPQFLGYMNLGVKLNYHYLNFLDSFSEHDLLAGIYLKLFKSSWIHFETGINYFSKFSVIPTITKFYGSLPFIHENSFAVTLHLSFYFLKKFSAGTSLDSISYFDYPVFFTPIINSYIEYEHDENFTIGVEMIIKMVDAIATIPNFRHIEITPYITFKF